jgi:putative transposase
MAGTFTSLTYHLIFSTKNREPWIAHEMESRLWSYMAGIVVEQGMIPLKIGGMPDHIHALVAIPPTILVSKALQLIKGPSSKWIHEIYPKMRGFAWQDGYGAFTVGRSQIVNIIKYIEGQREHHRARSFQEEFLAFLRRYEIAYDPKYIWG